MMDYIGKSPISVPVFIIGKAAFFGCALFFLVKIFAVAPMLFDSPFTEALGVILFLAGLFILMLSLLQLGRSAAVGLPERDTELKTYGMYRLSRNPVYSGAFIMCAGSCLYSIHVINLLLFAIAVGVHLEIVRKEEVFLANRFGKSWQEYRQQVPRFVGRIRRSETRRNNA